MVLWEIALGTAYFLGLKRTFKLALKIQRRIVSAKHPRIRLFLHRRTRDVFDVAVKAHKTVEQVDIGIGRNLGSWISGWLNRVKPSAEAHGHPNRTMEHMKMIKQATNSYMKHRASSRATIRQKLDRCMSITSSVYRWPKPFPTIAMIMRQPKLAGTGITIQHGQYFVHGSEAMNINYRRGRFDNIIREDIRQWMLRK